MGRKKKKKPPKEFIFRITPINDKGHAGAIFKLLRFNERNRMNWVNGPTLKTCDPAHWPTVDVSGLPGPLEIPFTLKDGATIDEAKKEILRVLARKLARRTVDFIE